MAIDSARLKQIAQRFCASNHASTHACKASPARAIKRTWTYELLEERRVLSANSGLASLDLSSLRFDPSDYAPSHVLVRFDESVTNAGEYLASRANAALQAIGKASALPLVPGLQKLGLGSGTSVEATLRALRSDPHVLYAEPDYIVRATGLSTDPMFADQWDFHNIGQTGGTLDADMDAPEAWDATVGTGATIVAVLDTGVDHLHPDLAANMWTNPGEIAGNGIDDDGNGYVDDIHGYDFYNEDGDPRDDHDHGTHVAGTIGAAGDNGVGIAGLNWNVQIMALKFLGSDGSGTTSDAIEALEYAVANGAHISNNSWGGDPYSQALYDAISDARQAGHIFVAAAGNGDFLGFGIDNDSTPFYPAGYDLDNIVSVAATDHNDQRAVFSNYGLTTVDLGAPGVSILSTTRNGTYGLNSGTSMAAPHVTGALSLVRDFDPSLTYTQIIDRVLASVDPTDSLEGATVTGGRLNVAAALVPDTFGPMVAGISPSGLTLDPMDSVRIVFDESIDASSFTLADVAEFTGPNGAIGPLSLAPVAGTNNRQFALSFPLQSTPGDYRLEITPGIVDRFGNVMDQDDDGQGGEAIDDRFVGEFHLADTVARFDFGTTSSAVANNYTRISRYDRYSTSIGYGWSVGSVSDIERGSGSALLRDVNYTHDATFVLDLPIGEYDIIATIGDSVLAHDEVGVFLEGVQRDTITTGPGQTAANTYRVTVTDGQLTFRLADLGGSDYWAMIQGLDIVYVGPDVNGPQVIAADPTGTITGPVDRIGITFNEAIDVASFTVADVLLLQGPNGSITPTAVNAVGSGQFEVVFPAQNTSGDYQLVLGAGILDIVGNSLDQDGDGIDGESPDDHFTTTFQMEAGPNYVGRFDFGTTSSPVEDRYTRITRYDRYDAGTGYGWLVGGVSDIERGSGTALTKDVNYTHDATFVLDLPIGEYDVIATIGDSVLAHDQVGVFLEGVQRDNITTTGGQSAINPYRITVTDGQLTFRLADLGGGDYWAMIQALDIIYIGPDVSGPQVLSVDPSGTVTGPIDRIAVSFNETIDAATFTLADVLSLTGPAGPITPSGINALGGGQFEVLFPAQNTSGNYQLVLGADITDIVGNAVDQDGDGLGGESPDDHFTTTFTLEAGPNYVGRFDYGTTTSPVEDRYTRITRYDRYDAGIGYGWLVGGVSDIARSTGTALTKDVNYTHDATFAMDLPNGDYDVIATIGDSVAHDQVGLFLEGVQRDLISTANGQSVVNTHRVTVTDGQLTLRLADLGGSNYWAMIQGLDVIAIASGVQSASIAAIDTAFALGDARDEAAPQQLTSHGLQSRFDLGDDDLLLLASTLGRQRGGAGDAAARDLALTAVEENRGGDAPGIGQLTSGL